MLFEELLQLLSKSDIKFIIVGGVACALNGFVRATEDVDILIDASQKNISSLLETLKIWGDGCAAELELADFPVSPGAVRVIEDFPLDIFTVLNEKTYDYYYLKSKKNRQGLLYLDPAGLIETKINSLREKDKIDILALKKIASP